MGKKEAYGVLRIMESGEMYLETVLVLSQKGRVRAVDVGEYMGFSKPSVSRAMSKLRAEELAVTDENGFITLTGKGEAIARKIYERHTILTEFLVGMGVSAETAAVDACKIEHDISDEAFDAIARQVKK